MKLKTITLSIALMFICSIPGFAHPAKIINPSFDARTDTLTVNITHTTTNPSVHYIYKIKILLNGRLVKEDDKLGAQDSANGTQYEASLRGVRAGDSIRIETYCNRGGKKVATMAVPDKSVSTSSSRSADTSSSSYGGYGY